MKLTADDIAHAQGFRDAHHMAGWLLRMPSTADRIAEDITSMHRGISDVIVTDEPGPVTSMDKDVPVESGTVFVEVRLKRCYWLALGLVHWALRRKIERLRNTWCTEPVRVIVRVR